MKQKCSCKPGQQRDNCPQCEGTGYVIDFAAIRAAKTKPANPAVAPMRGGYRTPDGRAQIEWSLSPKENGLEFSATGQYDGGAGQCLDQIAKAYPDDATVQRIVKVWRGHHLNGMNAGLPEQERWLADHRAADWDHTRVEKELRQVGLWEVPLPAGATATGGFPPDVIAGKRGYRYGERWVYAAIPDDVIAEIKSWLDVPQAGESLGEHQSKKFLEKWGIDLNIRRANTNPCPPFCDGKHIHGDKYNVRLERKATEQRLAFPFWNSHNDSRACKEPTAADVLGCAASDLGCPDTFEEFCAEYGFDPDSRKAKTDFDRCNRFGQQLRAFFNDEEMTADLQNIQH